MDRQRVIEAIERGLGRRKLIWFGTRGEDAQPLLEIKQLTEVFSLIAPLNTLSVEREVCLERLTGWRHDLDSYDLDADFSESALSLRASLLQSLRDPSVIAAYRPLAFLSSVYYPRRGHVEYLGLFHERQAPFEHKPWVETELLSLGIPTIPWKYFSDEDRQRVEEELSAYGSIVMRNNRSDGGAGFCLVKNREDLYSNWKVHPEGFFAVAPLMYPHIPLNVNCCVFSDGTVSMHGPSLQLIGIDGLTSRSFGYCGNDFAAGRLIERRIWDDLDRIVRSVAHWLFSKGYVGAFGIDAMVYDGELYLTEVNPRFQGSSAVSALLDAHTGRPDVFLCHTAALLGIKAEFSEKLYDLAQEQPAMAQILVHNTGKTPKRCKDAVERYVDNVRLTWIIHGSWSPKDSHQLQDLWYQGVASSLDTQIRED